MKKKFLLLFVAVVMVMSVLSIGAMAAETTTSYGIYNITSKVTSPETCTITPKATDGSAVTGVNGFYQDAVRFDVTCKLNELAGSKQALLLVVNGSGAPTENNVVYMDQITSDEAQETMEAYPSGLVAGNTYYVYVTVQGRSYAPVATFEYVAQRELTKSDVTLVLDQAGYTYTGNAICPAVSVTDGTDTLTKDKDYTVSYDNNTDAGEATVTITGQGRYTGTVEETFEIKQAPLTIAGAAVAEKTYNGATNDANVTAVTFDNLKNGEQLTLGTDYAVSGVYADANAGDAVGVAVTVDLKDTAKANNYTLIDPTFNTTGKINKTTATLSISAQNAVYTGVEYAESNLTASSSVATVAYTYYSDADCTTEVEPINVGTYYVKGVLAESTNATTAEAKASFQITRAPLTIKAKDHTITYGDVPAANGVDYDGFVNGETSGVLTGTLAYTHTYQQFGNVGSSYTITPSGLEAANYAITFRSGTLTVAQKEIGLTWSGHTGLTYDGTAKNVTASVSNKVEGDEVNVTVTGGSETNAGTYTAEATGLTGSKAGNYKLPADNTFKYNIAAKDVSGVSVADIAAETYDGTARIPVPVVKDGNKTLTEGTDYTVSYANNTNAGTATAIITGQGNYTGTKQVSFTIEKRAITITMDSKTRTYGDANPEFTWTVSGEVVSGDTVTVTPKCAATAATGIGTAVIDGTVSASGNYDVTLVTGVLTITAKQLSESAVQLAAGTHVYNGSAVKPGVTVKDGDKTLTEGTDYTVNYADNTNAGTGKVTITYQGNYTGTVTKTFAISKAMISIIGATVTDKVYDGQTNNANVTAVTFSGVSLTKGTDYTVTGVYESKNAGDAVGVTVTVTLAEELAENYVLESNSYHTTGVVSRKAVTVSGITAGDKTYDGTTAAVVNTANAVFTGKVDGDALTIVATGAFADANAGENKTVNLSGLTLGGTDAGNYVLASDGQQTAATAKISKADLTIKAKDHTITYGDAPAANGVDYDGFVNGETSGVLTGTLAYTHTYQQFGDVGSSYTITPYGLESANYTVYFVPGTLTVKVKPLAVTAGDLVISKTYDGTVTAGTAQAGTALGLTGVVNQDAVSVTYTGISNYADANAGENKAVTISGLALEGAKKNNYTISVTELAVNCGQIDKKTLMAEMLQAALDTVTYDGTAKTVTVTLKDSSYSGMGAVTVKYDGSTTAPTNAGTYPITVSVAAGDNFNATTADLNMGSFIIAPKSIGGMTASVAQSSYVYTGEEMKPAVTVKDGDKTLSAGEDYTVMYSGNVAVGTATITITGDGNYTGTKTVSFSITRKTPALNTEYTVTLPNTPVYDGEAKAAVASKIVAAIGDMTVKYNGSTEIPSDAGTYRVTVDIAESANYAGVTDAYVGTFTIAQKDIANASVEVTGTYAYTGSAIIPTATVTLDGKTLEEDEYSVSCTDHTDAGTATVTITGEGNYIGTAATTFQIEKRPITITMDSKTRTYGDANPEFTWTVAPGALVGNDTAAVLTVVPNCAANVNTGVGTMDITGTAAADNYAVTVNNGTLTIEKALLTITGATVADKVYNGEKTDANVTAVTFGNLKNGEQLTLGTDYTVSGVYADANAGDVVEVTVTVSLLDTAVTGNYDLQSVTFMTQGRVTAKATTLDITAANAVYTGKAYDKANITQTNSESGTVTYTYYRDADCTETVIPINVGTYYAKGVLAASVNTAEATDVAMFQITPAALTITAKDHTITYGDELANSGVTYSGFVNNENESVVSGLTYEYGCGRYDGVDEYSDAIIPGGAEAANYDITFRSGKLTVTQKEVGLEWSGHTDLTYDGDAKNVIAIATGLVNNDVVGVTVTGGTEAAMGSYTATATALTGDKAGNYKLPATGTTQAYTIAAKSLTNATVEAIGAVTYNGTAHTPAPVVKDGGVTLASGMDYTVSYANNTNAGTATVTITGTGNYTGTKTVTFTIEKRAITITMDSKTRTYGDANPEFTWTVAPGALVGNDTAAVLTVVPNCVATIATDVSVVDITGTAAADNYAVTVNKGTLTIEQRVLTVTGGNLVITKIYDGTVSAGSAQAGTALELTNVVNGDDVSVTYTGISDYADASVGENKTVTISGLALDGAKKNNYTIRVASIDITGGKVTKAALEAWMLMVAHDTTVYNSQPQAVTVAFDERCGSGIGTVTVKYNGSTAAPTNAGTYAVTVSVAEGTNFSATAEDLSVGTFIIHPKSIADVTVNGINENGYVYTGNAVMPIITVKDANATLIKGTDYTVAYSGNVDVGTATITFTGTGNYTGTKTENFVINKKVLTVTALDQTIGYGTALDTANVEVTYTGLAGRDTAEELGQLTLTTDYTVNSPVSGTYSVTPSGLSGEKAANYDISYVSGSVTVTPKDVSGVTVESIGAVTYNGTVHTPAPVVKDGGVTLTSGTDYTVSYANNTNAGTATVTITGAGNYTGTKTVTFTVEQLEAELSWAGHTDLTYTGTAKAVTATVSNKVEGDEVSVTVTGGSETNAGDYTAEAAGLTGNAAGNYKLPDAVTRSYTIAKASLTITAKDHAITYGDELANSGVTYSGFVNNENESVVSGLAYEYGCGRYDGVGEYSDAIIPGGAEAANYDITFRSGKLTVTQKEVGLTWSGHTDLTYDGDAKNVIAIATGLVNNDVVGVTVTGGTEAAMGSYTATATALTGDKAGNYKLPATGTTQAYTIAAKSLTNATVEAIGAVTYNGTAHTPAPVVKDGGVTLASGMDYTVSYANNTNAGTATVTITGTGNYTGTKTVTFTIEQLEAELSWAGHTDLSYTGTAKAVTATVSNKVEGDEVNVTVTGGSETNAGTYTVEAAGLTGSKAGNYKLPAAKTQSYTIAKAALTITDVAVAAKVYNGVTTDAEVLSVTFGGLQNGERLTMGTDFAVSGVYGHENAGDAVPVTVMVAMGNTAKTGNYELAVQTFATTGKVLQTETTLRITAADAVYTGVRYAESNITKESSVQDAVIYTYYSDAACTNQVDPVNVGTYYVKGVIAESPNASAAEAVASFQITKAPLTITANGRTIIYGDAPANSGVTYSGFVNDETYSVLTAPVAYEYSYAQYGNVGSYAITPKGAEAANYVITFRNGTLTVTQKEVGLTWSGYGTLYYDGQAKNVAAAATGTVNGDDIAVTVAGGKQVNVGSYTAAASGLTGAKAGNYKLPAVKTQSYSIVPALTDATVTLYTGNSQTPDAETTVTATIDGLTIKLVGYRKTDQAIKVNGVDASAGKLTANGVEYTIDVSGVEVMTTNVTVTTHKEVSVSVNIGEGDISDAEREILNALATSTASGNLGNSISGVIADVAEEEVDLPEEAVEVEIQVKVILIVEAKEVEDDRLRLEIKPVYEVIHVYKDLEGTTISTETVKEDEPVHNTEIKVPMTVRVHLPDTGFTPTYAKHYLANGKYEYLPVTIIVEGGVRVATWQQSSFSEVELIDDSRETTVTFRFDSGNTQTVTYTNMDVNTALPADSRSGYTFNGWTFSAGTGETKYTALSESLLDALDTLTVIATPQFTKISTPAGSGGGGGGGGAAAVPATYTIIATSGADGAISPSGFIEVDEGTDQSFSFLPNAGYRVKEVKVDGKVVAVTNSYTFKDVEDDHTIAVTFEKGTAVNPFVDVKESAYYYAPVLWAMEQGITGGVTPTTFVPNSACTRGQMVTFLWRAAGKPEPVTAVNPFTDVSPSAYYYKAVLWAVEQGITNGTTATAFSPNSACTRGQMATFLWRAEGKPVISGENVFTDVTTSNYYYDAVRWAAAQSITTGKTATTFAPAEGCTRGQMVTFLYRSAQAK